MDGFTNVLQSKITPMMVPWWSSVYRSEGPDIECRRFLCCLWGPIIPSDTDFAIKAAVAKVIKVPKSIADMVVRCRQSRDRTGIAHSKWIMEYLNGKFEFELNLDSMKIIHSAEVAEDLRRIP
jgi:hypothetical protein